jgi:hypothetical protein
VSDPSLKPAVFDSDPDFDPEHERAPVSVSYGSTTRTIFTVSCKTETYFSLGISGAMLMSSFRPVNGNHIPASVPTLLETAGNQKLFIHFAAEQTHRIAGASLSLENISSLLSQYCSIPYHNRVSTLKKGLL